MFKGSDCFPIFTRDSRWMDVVVTLDFYANGRGHQMLMTLGLKWWEDYNLFVDAGARVSFSCWRHRWRRCIIHRHAYQVIIRLPVMDDVPPLKVMNGNEWTVCVRERGLRCEHDDISKFICMWWWREKKKRGCRNRRGHNIHIGPRPLLPGFFLILIVRWPLPDDVGIYPRPPL